MLHNLWSFNLLSNNVLIKNNFGIFYLSGVMLDTYCMWCLHKIPFLKYFYHFHPPGTLYLHVI